MLTDRIDLFTQALNAAFVRSYEAMPPTAAIDKAITEVPSAGRVENYPWLYPPPLMHQWFGMRQYAHLGETNYRVPNVTYTAEFECPLEDLEDDQIDGFKLQAAAMAKGARQYARIQTQLTLANGQTTTCFDGTNFFASSHTVGTGNNIVTGTASGGDSVTHAMAALVVTNNMVKPLLWQRREGPDFRTDAGEVISSQSRMVHWWADMRGAAFVGFWWDACLAKFTNTPTVSDMQTTLGTINKAFRQFTLPKNLASDPNQYPHLNTEFTKDTLIIVCSTGIDHILRQALTLSLVGATENPYVGFAQQVTSGYMDTVV